MDITHEALIRQWDRLQEWTTDEAKQADQYRDLERAARLWEREGREEAQLFGGRALESYLDWKTQAKPTTAWAERYGGRFELAMEFLSASEAKRDEDLQKEVDARKKEEVRRQRELEDAHELAAERDRAAAAERKRAEAERERAEAQARVAKRLSLLSLGLVVVVALAIGAGLYAWWLQNEAEDARVEAEQAKVRADKERDRAEEALAETEEAKTDTEAALAKAETARDRAERATIAAEESARAEEIAKEVAKASEARRTEELFKAQLTHASLLAEGEDYAAARSVLEESRARDPQIPLGRRHGRDFLARYVETLGGGAQQVYEEAGVPLFSAAVSPDGRLLAAVGENGTVVLFDVESGEVLQRLEGHRGHVWDVVFHATGEWLATGGADGQVIRWSLPAEGARAEPLQAWDAQTPVWSLAVSPDGTLLASGGEGNDIRHHGSSMGRGQR